MASPITSNRFYKVFVAGVEIEAQLPGLNVSSNNNKQGVALYRISLSVAVVMTENGRAN